MRATIIAAACAFVFTGCATLGPDAPVKIDSGVFVDYEKGMTLYTFDRDPRGRSACVTQCAANWPPFHPAANARAAGPFTILAREDGTRQWMYKEKPLYFWIKDRAPGDRTGDGVNNLWRVARP